MLPAPIVCPPKSVQQAWIDYNGHMNMAFAATSEQLALHVDMQSRRTAPFPAEIQARLSDLMAAHRGLSVPDQVGHVIGIPARGR